MERPYRFFIQNPSHAIRNLAFVLMVVLVHNNSYSQSDSIGVFIPRDGASPFKGPKLYMWVDLKNIVFSTQMGNAELLKVYTNNGRADQPAYYGRDQYAITPAEEGDVTVFTIQRIKRGEKWDTVTTVNNFIAVYQPEIRLMIMEDSLLTKCELKFFLADKYKFTPLDGRYVVANAYEPVIYNEKDEYVGKLPSCKGTEINCNTEPFNFKLEPGLRIVFQVMVRDLKTDLLLAADECVHIIG
jgi:hypothetical protein